MKHWNNLPKQKQLLIFMLNLEASQPGEMLIIGRDAHKMVKYGISATKSALRMTLNILSKKGYIENRGRGLWCLTIEGQLEAKHWMEQCDDCMEVLSSVSSKEEKASDYLERIQILKHNVEFLREHVNELEKENAKLRKKLVLARKILVKEIDD